MLPGVATACMIVGSLVTLAAVWLMLQRGVVAPLRKIAEHVTEIGRNGNLKSPLHLQRKDEIGTLANAFDEGSPSPTGQALHSVVVKDTLLQATARRLDGSLETGARRLLAPVVVANENYRFITAEQLAARRAGMIPEIIPTTTDASTASNTARIVRSIGIS